MKKHEIKVYLVGEEKCFGYGPRKLLGLIDELGSINLAASEMGMSYNKALKMIKAIEREIDSKVLMRKQGGIHGGGSQLTDSARDLIKRYDEFKKRLSEASEELYEEIFDRD